MLDQETKVDTGQQEWIRGYLDRRRRAENKQKGWGWDEQDVGDVEALGFGV